MNPRFLKKVNYKGEDAYLFLVYYADNKKGLMLNSTDSPKFTQDSYILTSNISATLSDEIAINDHDYHKGNYDFLIKEGIVIFSRIQQSGWVEYPVCRLVLNSK